LIADTFSPSRDGGLRCRLLSIAAPLRQRAFLAERRFALAEGLAVDAQEQIGPLASLEGLGDFGADDGLGGAVA
jgi:hypothetical protein